MTQVKSRVSLNGKDSPGKSKLLELKEQSTRKEKHHRGELQRFFLIVINS
jgi:hypothetical protein